jgi:hypothetical protein
VTTRADQKSTAALAFAEAVTVVVGLGLFVTSLSDYTSDDLSATESVAFIADHEPLMYVWNTITLVLFGVLLVPLALSLHQRLKPGAPEVARAATAFGLIWAGLLLAGGMVTNIGLGVLADLHAGGAADAGAVWTTLDAVQNGLTGGNEIVGGLWILLISWAGLRSGALPRAMNYLGLLMGATALATIVPALEDVGAVFGLGLIIWFVWFGVISLQNPAEATHDEVVAGGA